MSILVYMESRQELVLTRLQAASRQLIPLGRWPAHNETASNSNGPWPAGLFKYSHYNPHAEAGLFPAALTTAYGGTGIHVFSVPGRPGMGVHAGRTRSFEGVGGKTMGCIRVSTTAMMAINDQHRTDPLTHIYVARNTWMEATGDITRAGTGAHAA